MRVSTVELDKAIEWCKETIEQKEECLKTRTQEGMYVSGIFYLHLERKLKACETALAVLQSVKERGGFI